jgi:cytochrome c oxidase cbb3-type subunit 3
MQERKQQNKPRGHEFDGIQEFDNDMPRWWVYLFIVTVIFSVFYLAWYHLPFFPSKSLSAEYDEDVAEHKALIKEKNMGQPSGGYNYAAVLADNQVKAKGKETYDINCAPCHATDGGGGVGANLTDKFWIHGSSVEQIEHILKVGAVEKGMPAWEPVLGIDKVRELVVYVHSLKGTVPASPKEAQGVEE